MEKQKIALGLVLMLVCSSLMISGCTQQNSSSDQTNPPSTETFQEILMKAEAIESVYYEVAIVESVSGAQVQNITMKIWQKAPYLREDVTYMIPGAITNLSMIQRSEGMYQYDSTQNTYVPVQGIDFPQLSIGDFARDLLNNQTITLLKTETIEGKLATVFQYSPSQPGNSTTMKMWIWNEKGVPLKAFLTTTKEETTMTMDYQYHNYSFIDIPESTFSIS